jgi:hypothetical protein
LGKNHLEEQTKFHNPEVTPSSGKRTQACGLALVLEEAIGEQWSELTYCKLRGNFPSYRQRLHCQGQAFYKKD